MKQTKLTKSAKGKECHVRIPGICCHDPAKVVLAHLPGAGMGMKALDIHGAYACYKCHDEIDRRTRHIPSEQARMCHLEGVIRTQQTMVKEGLISYG